MRIAIDYTSAVYQRAGVGRYTRSLAGQVVSRLEDDDRVVLWYASTSRAPVSLPAGSDPERVTTRRLPISPRLASIAWHRARVGWPIDRLVGKVDLHHEPDFVSPPTRAPMVTTIHDLSYLIVPEYAHPDLKKYLERSVPKTLERARQIIAVSESTRQDVIDHYLVNPDRVTTIYNGVDAWFQAPGQAAIERSLQQFGLRRPYFLMVGTVEPRKNHLTALKAFSALYARRRDASLVIVGNPGWLSEPIVDEIERCAKTMAVRYLRFVDDTWIPSLYAGSVALLAPSWYEGFGLPALEAMSCGTAVVASDRGALPEVVGEDGVVLPPGDAEAMAHAMERLLDDQVYRNGLAARGRERAEGFTWDRAALAHIKLYHEIGDGS